MGVSWEWPSLSRAGWMCRSGDEDSGCMSVVKVSSGSGSADRCLPSGENISLMIMKFFPPSAPSPSYTPPVVS